VGSLKQRCPGGHDPCLERQVRRAERLGGSAGEGFRIPNVVDDATREGLAPIADTSICGRRVARELTAFEARRSRPGSSHLVSAAKRRPSDS
jgi:hypothetical protein